MIPAFKVAIKTLTATTVPRRLVSPVMNAALNKIADKKQKFAAAELLIAAAMCLGPKTVVEASIKSASATKAVTVHMEVLDLQATIVKEFGAVAVPVKELLAYAKGPQALGSTLPALKKSAVAMVGELYHQLGDPVRSMMSDGLKPAQLKALEAHFDTVGHDPAAASKATKSARGTDVEPVSSVADLMDELNPRVDITSQVSSKLLKYVA